MGKIRSIAQYSFGAALLFWWLFGFNYTDGFKYQSAAICALIAVCTFSDNIVKRKLPSTKEIADTVLGAICIIVFFAFLTSGRGCTSYSTEDNCDQSPHGALCK